MRGFTSLLAAVTATTLTLPAAAGYTLTQSKSAPTYTDRQLTFDEDGGPTGVIDPDYWLGTHGLRINAGDGVPQVDDWDDDYGGWGLGDGNSFFGNFGVFMNLDHDTNAMSFQVWDPAGPPNPPFGGGLGIFLFNDGEEVAGGFDMLFTPAWGGIGDTWFNLTSDGGDVFDEIRVLGFGASPITFVDTLSWQVVPAPGSFALIGLVGLAGGRRRRL